VFRDIDAKRAVAAYLHMAPVAFAEAGDAARG
jgi:hypothetical protein